VQRRGQQRQQHQQQHQQPCAAPLAYERAGLIGRVCVAGGSRHVPLQRELSEAAAQPLREEGACLWGVQQGAGAGWNECSG
jgi:hypothetical protein